jgi:hypothetical protein
VVAIFRWSFGEMSTSYLRTRCVVTHLHRRTISGLCHIAAAPGDRPVSGSRFHVLAGGFVRSQAGTSPLGVLASFLLLAPVYYLLGGRSSRRGTSFPETRAILQTILTDTSLDGLAVWGKETTTPQAGC